MAGRVCVMGKVLISTQETRILGSQSSIISMKLEGPGGPEQMWKLLWPTLKLTELSQLKNVACPWELVEGKAKAAKTSQEMADLDFFNVGEIYQA